MAKFPEVVFSNNPVFARLWKRGPKPNGGKTIAQPLGYAAGNGGSYSPRAQLNIAAVDQVTTAEFNWKYYYVPIAMFRDEILRNGSPEGVKSLLDMKMKISRSEIADDIATDLFLTSSSYSGDSDNGVNSLVGACANAAYPAATIAYGGITKSSANSFWHGDVNTATASGNLSLPDMMDSFIAVSIYGSTPDLIVTNQDRFSDYWALVAAQERFMHKDVDGYGFGGLLFNTVPVVMDSHCNADEMYFLTSDYLHLVSHKKENMRLEPFMKPIDQNAAVAKIYWAGNLTCSDCRRQGVLYDI
jgi:hypothetical protein